MLYFYETPDGLLESRFKLNSSLYAMCDNDDEIEKEKIKRAYEVYSNNEVILEDFCDYEDIDYDDYNYCDYECEVCIYNFYGECTSP